MLKKVILENFKCYKRRNEFPLAPITLIYGPNSGGKSTLLQALKLLRQTSDMADRNTRLLFSCRNGLVNLGSFENSVYGHDCNLNITIGLESDTSPPTSVTEDYFNDRGPSFYIRHSQYDSTLSPGINGLNKRMHETRLFSYEMTFSDNNGNTVLNNAIMQIDGASLSVESAVFSNHHNFVTKVEDHEAAHKYFLKHRESVLKGMKLDRAIKALMSVVAVEPLQPEEKINDRMETESFYAAYDLLETEYAAMAELFSHDFTLAEYKKVAGKEVDRSFCMINKFMPEYNPVANMFGTDNQNELNYLHTSGEGLKIYPSEERVRICVHKCWDDSFGDISELLGRLCPSTNHTNHITWSRFFEIEIRNFLSNLYALAPVRPEAKPVYNLAEAKAANDDAYDSGFVALLAGNNSVQKAVNDWLMLMQVGYEVEVESLDHHLPGHCVVRLYDVRGTTRTLVSLGDVGYGISQVLPVIASCVARRATTLLIEQPELHIHPRLQAELGELFKDAVIKQQHQLIIETHSEHLMLRIQKLIRKGELKPDDVSVLYVSRGEDGSNVQQLRLDTDGEFLDPWPDGFFPERMTEIFG